MSTLLRTGCSYSSGGIVRIASSGPQVEQILAWRNVGKRRAERIRTMNHGKDKLRLDVLTREFLVKFQDQSWCDVDWVPYAWLE